MKRIDVRWLCVTMVALSMLAAPLVAQQTGSKPINPRELRTQLEPVYKALQTDAQYLKLKNQLEGKMRDHKVVDQYLQYLPVSPLELLKIDMDTNHYEYGIPRYMAEWHVRWIALHENQARQFYGNTYVDLKLAGWKAEPAGDNTTVDGVPTPKAATVGTNRNTASTASPAPETYQGEIQVVVNPNNPNQIVAAANTWDDINGTCGDGIQAVFYSSDGGATWGYSCPPGDSGYSGMNCSGGNFVFGSDPALAWNDNNEVFLNHMLICQGSSTGYAMVVARSTNGGATWTGQGVIKNSWSTGDLEDKNFYIIDNTSTSPYYGRHYTCWDRNNNEKMAYSTNNGASWTEVDLPTSSGNGTGSRFDLGCDLAVGSDGTVHIVFNTLSCLSSCNNEEMFYTRSTNGGASWSTPVEVRDFNLVAFSSNSCPDAQDQRCIGPFGGIAVDNSGGACDGNLYATFSDFTSGNGNNSDVWISRSTNNGSTWQTPVLVNDDGLSGRAQFHPFVQVDQSNGHVVVGWHDARNDSGNDAIDYFVTRSTDCGVSYETNVQASQASSEFNNSSISYSNENSSDNPNYNPNQYGEYMGVDAMNGKAYLAWTDTRHFFPGSTSESQEENVGFAIVDFGAAATCGNNTVEGSEICDGTDLDGETCTSQGFTGGTLACNATCTGFDTSSCTGGAVCGNNTIEGSEVCDGTDLGGETCVSQGFAGGGTLACNGSCSAFDTSSCSTGSCTTSSLYSNGFESGSGLSDWTRGSFGSGNTNNWRGIQTCTAATGSKIFRFGGSNCTRNYGSNRFIYSSPQGSTGISVPAGSSDTTLNFDHRRQFETGYDGGLVALSLDGSNYTVVSSSAITGASYNGTVNAACAPSGSAGLPIFTGTQSSFVSTEVDLDAVCDAITSGSGGCAGQTLYIAFTGITDCSANRDGWFLDNVEVTACTP